MELILNFAERKWLNLTKLQQIDILRNYNLSVSYYNNFCMETRYIFVLKEELIEDEYNKEINNY